MSEPVVYVFHYVAPIPVGHRVEVHFFARDTGFFATDFHEQLDMPLIRDLDTGVEYAPEWLFERKPGPPELSPTVQATRTVTGRVIACRVVAGLSGADWTAHTRLTLREEDRRIYR